jgi:CMP-N-acetylneuraminic acid synthetase
MEKNIVALIPARGGSKGIPRKNIMNIAGKPLIAWSIEAAKGCPYISRVIVSSDDDEILAVAKSLGAETLKRPEEFATDKARSEPVVTHALEILQQEGALPEWILYLQPTSPLRTAAHLTAAAELLEKAGASADGLISVKEGDNKFLKAYRTSEEGYLAGVVNNDYPNWNRQDLPKIYMPNGAIYIMRAKGFLEKPRFWNEKTIPFVMTEAESADLDSMEDVAELEAKLTQ